MDGQVNLVALVVDYGRLSEVIRVYFTLSGISSVRSNALLIGCSVGDVEYSIYFRRGAG